MKPGGGKRKGSAFEREVCKALSLWLSNGKKTDIFWRSAMSGGRATFHKRKGVDIRQSGDITAVAAEGHEITDKWFIECKFIRDAKFGKFLFRGIGPTSTFWKKVLKEAANHNKDPMLIIKSHNYPIMVITKVNHLRHFVQPVLETHTRGSIDVTSFTDWICEKYEP